MNITIEQNHLENILSNLQPFLEKKDASQITSHICLKAKDNELLLQSTDYEIGLLTKTENIQISKEGAATINGKRILEIVRRLNQNSITLTTENDFLMIRQGKSYFKLPMFNAEEFPAFPSYSELPKIEINSTHLVHSMKKILPAIDNNNPKFELNGALLDIKEYSFNFVATDTRRLAIVKYENPSVNTLSLIVPKKAITEIQKLFFDEVELYYSETHLILKSQSYLFFTKLINGKYPDYERIIPKETIHNMSLSKDKIIEAIRLITSISNDIKITFKSDEIIFESLSDENSEAKTEVEVETGIQKEITLGVNSKYFLDSLSQIDTNEFSIGINEANTPFIIKSQNFSTVIMPIVM